MSMLPSATVRYASQSMPLTCWPWTVTFCVIPCGAASTKPFEAAKPCRPDVAMKFEFVSPLPWSAITNGSRFVAAAVGTTRITERLWPAAVIIFVDVPGVSAAPLPDEPEDEEDDDEEDEDDDVDPSP